ncbi:hypothetical protein [Humisphaera borealis]|uniref:Uncharacterized protein n=1 Tax=Humisphaera borealis TaxID=2807512 RepID=A0A7M2WVX5_9BACT|nr:hypothetical protein [Humisphaera borealis]QOV89616.1 hypothetical protein IPV69_26070 [Humisphaera borealis]
MATTDPTKPADPGIVIAASARPGQGTITARKAGGLRDMALPVSPREVSLAKALQNLAKAINIAFSSDFLENELEQVYKAARVRKGTVEILHGDFIGLGDGVLATIGKVGKSVQLTLSGPDPSSPEGKAILAKNGGGSFRGVANFLGRKLNLLQEYEDKVPMYVEQTLDRLEAAQMITGWHRDQWQISTKVVGLDVVIKPVAEETASKTAT